MSPYSVVDWVDNVTPLDAANMDHLEAGVAAATTTAEAAIPKPASPASNDALLWNGSAWVGAKLTSASISASAGIAKTQLAALNIGDADVSSLSISKLAGYPSDGTKFAAGDGTWKVVTVPVPLVKRAGTVGSAGAILAGTGFTVSKGATGLYTVTFSPALTTLTAIVGTVVGQPAGHSTIVCVLSSSTSSFNVELRDNTTSAGLARDYDWSFMASGT